MMMMSNQLPGNKKNPAKSRVCVVEAAGQLFHIFRYGPDYSFTCIMQGRACCGSSI
jgi:hypothetical protein